MGTDSKHGNIMRVDAHNRLVQSLLCRIYIDVKAKSDQTAKLPGKFDASTAVAPCNFRKRLMHGVCTDTQVHRHCTAGWLPTAVKLSQIKLNVETLNPEPFELRATSHITSQWQAHSPLT